MRTIQEFLWGSFHIAMKVCRRGMITSKNAVGSCSWDCHACSCTVSPEEARSVGRFDKFARGFDGPASCVLQKLPQHLDVVDDVWMTMMPRGALRVLKFVRSSGSGRCRVGTRNCRHIDTIVEEARCSLSQGSFHFQPGRDTLWSECQVGQTWCRKRSLRDDMRPSSPIVGQPT